MNKKVANNEYSKSEYGRNPAGSQPVLWAIPISPYTMRIVVQLERVAPHWLRSYFGFCCMIVYIETVTDAKAVAPIAVITDRIVYKEEMGPMKSDSPNVKIASHHHLLGDCCRALGLTATRKNAMVEIITPARGMNSKGEAVAVIDRGLKIFVRGAYVPNNIMIKAVKPN